MTTHLCQYRFRNGTTCAESSGNGSNLCFWHDPKTDKRGKDIKERLQNKHKNGERLEGFQLKGADLDDVYLIRSDAFYYSVVTFTTLGYGDFTHMGIGKLLAIMESFSGAFLIALFVITIYKRYMER